VKATFGYAKQGAGRGYTGVKGLNVLLAIISTPGSRPVIAAARLRKGSTNSARGAHRLVADALSRPGPAARPSALVLRADSAFFQSIQRDRRGPAPQGLLLDHRARNGEERQRIASCAAVTISMECSAPVTRSRVECQTDFAKTASTCRPGSASSRPPLTTIDLNLAELGNIAATRLLDAIDGVEVGSGVEVVPPTLVKRRSTEID